MDSPSHFWGRLAPEVSPDFGHAIPPLSERILQCFDGSQQANRTAQLSLQLSRDCQPTSRLPQKISITIWRAADSELAEVRGKISRQIKFRFLAEFGMASLKAARSPSR